MDDVPIDTRVYRHLVDSLYVDAMVLADEARAYFDDGGRLDRDGLDPMTRVGFSCESLKVTTRLMHVIAWLLTQRAVQAGEMTPGDALDPTRRLGTAPESDAALVDRLPPKARDIVDTSIDLFRRTARLDAIMATPVATASPVQRMLATIAGSF